jgi:hypothetical protein
MSNLTDRRTLRGPIPNREWDRTVTLTHDDIEFHNAIGDLEPSAESFLRTVFGGDPSRTSAMEAYLYDDGSVEVHIWEK